MTKGQKKQVENTEQQFDGIYLTAPQAARMLQISREEFYRKLAAGQIPGAIKMWGKTWRIERVTFMEGLRAMGNKDGGE